MTRHPTWLANQPVLGLRLLQALTFNFRRVHLLALSDGGPAGKEGLLGNSSELGMVIEKLWPDLVPNEVPDLSTLHAPLRSLGVEVALMARSPAWLSSLENAFHTLSATDRQRVEVFEAYARKHLVGVTFEGKPLSNVMRELRFNDEWSMDNGLGVLNSPVPGLMRDQYRFFLPSATMQGVQTQLRQGAGRVELQAGTGRPGVFEGTRLAGFDPRQGRISTVTGQAVIGGGWTVGGGVMDAQVERERGDRANWDFLYEDSKSASVAAAWEGPRDRYQANVLGSRADGQKGQGGWLEGYNSRGRYTHRYGAFYLDPGIAWGLAPINNDLKGVYYRLGYQYGRWDWNTGVDSIRSVSGNGVDGWFATGYGRYQASRTLGLGASGSAREDQGQMADSVSVFGDKRFAKNQVRLQLDAADDGAGTRDARISVDNAFVMQGSNRLAVNLAYAQTRGNPEWDGSQTSLSVYGGRDLTDTLSLDGTVRWTSSTGGTAVRGGDANVGLNWRPNNRWVISANYYRSEGTQRTPFDLDPIVPVDRRMNLPRSSSVYLNLRYDWGAGRPAYVVGGAPGAAVGSVRGTVFLDENRNGLRDANEQPVANITVTIDGRYSVRTDATGRYEFPLVATGSHQITVVADNVPLPWSFDQNEQTIVIGTRSDVVLDVGATKPK